MENFKPRCLMLHSERNLFQKYCVSRKCEYLMPPKVGYLIAWLQAFKFEHFSVTLSQICLLNSLLEFSTCLKGVL